MPEAKYKRLMKQQILEPTNRPDVPDPDADNTKYVDIHDEGEDDGGNIPKQQIEQIISFIPKSLKTKASTIMKFIETRGGNILNVNKDGTLIYKGTPLEGSNIIDLLRASMYHYKDFQPIGQEQFYNGLKELNFPSSYLQEFRHNPNNKSKTLKRISHFQRSLSPLSQPKRSFKWINL